MNTRAQIKRATLLAHRAMESLDAETQSALAVLYKSQAAEIATRIRNHAGPDDNIALQELRSLLSQVESIVQRLGMERDALLNEALAKAAEYGSRPVLGAILDTGAMVSTAASMTVAEDAVRFVRSFVAADGLQLSDRIWRLDRGARDTVINAIERAVIQGHGAAQAAHELLARGEVIPVDLRAGLNAASTNQIIKHAADPLFTGSGSPMDNAMRLMRTEINRAHGEAYMLGGDEHPDFAGWRFLLSPQHPKHDICDLLSTQNLYGLGPGVYPNREKLPWPAHPNTLSFVEIVFKDEITEADRAGKETPMQALARLNPEQRQGLLGKGKSEIYDAGKLTQGMIRAPLAAVEKRVGVLPKTPSTPAKPKPVTLGLDDFIRLGAVKGNDLIARAGALGDVSVHLPEVLFKDLNTLRPTNTPAKLFSKGKGAELVSAASRLFPDAWTKVADDFGPLYVKGSQSRGWQLTLHNAVPGSRYKANGFDFITKGNDGLIVAGRFATAVHEYTHRLQHAITGLDDLFQDLHHRRTAGEPIKSLRSLTGIRYASSEVTREDKYINPYQGKIYSGGNRYLGKHGAMEVMTMAFESVLAGKPLILERLLQHDREMFDLVIGALYHYVP